uniref:SD-repeat containing protein B domain-containing protein n=1 Tax=Ciona savignyi TaxID=51511 RepID=H2ZM50_CIOSA
MMKYQAECAPNNGYFMVPFVEKGEFQLKIIPPKGWLFEPMSVDLNVDGINDPCTKGKDINFAFKGFTLSGKVLSSGPSASGPEGVTVKLSDKSTKKLISTTKTIDGGSFNFEGVSGGNYVITASHETYTFKQHQTEVHVTTGNKVCANEIVVSGYDVHGKVTALNLPVTGVNLLLFAKESLPEQLTGCLEKRPTGSDGVSNGEYPVYLCSVVSNAEGQYNFPSLPPADYIIIPFHRGEHIQFDVEPRELKFSVVNQRLIHQPGFKVTGFSVQGRVLDTVNGNPIEGADVFIKAEKQDTTDKNGYYTLKHMNSGLYQVEFKKADINFPITKLRVGPDTPILPTIIAESFSLCGRVSISDSPTANFAKSQIAVDVSSKDESKSQKTHLKDDGSFCVMAKPGEYVIKPVLSKSMVDAGLSLLPSETKVTIVNSPKREISFVQYRGSFVVQMSCIAACKDASVTVVADGRPQRKPLTRKVSSKENTTSVKFSDVLPGEYSVRVSHPNWCWGSESEKITVSSKPVKDAPRLANFEQSGFALVCTISHDIGLEIHHAGERVDVFSLKKGRNRLCLSQLGEYLLQPQSCHQFDVKTPLKYDTTHPKPITLQAVAHQALVTMETSYLVQDADHRVAMEIKTSKGNGKFLVILDFIVINDYLHSDKIVRLNSTRQSEIKFCYLNEGKSRWIFITISSEKTENLTTTNVYKVTYWAGDGEKLEFAPKSDVLLFEPNTFTATMKAGECAKELVRFKGIVGKFIEGQISPPLPNIDILISSNGSEGISIKTDQTGKYRYGPVHPDFEYKISASMEDYALSPVLDKPGDFSAKKLSKMHFLVKMDSGETPLAGVLLSISGGSYRSNNLTEKDGRLTLSKLYVIPIFESSYFWTTLRFLNFHQSLNFLISGQYPGQYYFKAMMKEYQFDPSSKVIDVVEGKETQLDITGKRVAYSCYGSVTSLNGEAEPSSVVRAKAKEAPEHCKGHIEEATVGNDGEYRVRGLRPGCHYDVTVRDSSERFSRVAPEHVTLETKEADAHGFRFIAFRHMTGFELSGRVVTEQDYLQHIKMVLYRSTDPSSPVHTVSLTRASPFFHFPSVPRDETEYVLRVESTLATSVYEYSTPGASFFAQGPHKHITFRFEPKLKSVEQETPQASLLTLPLTLIAVALAYNYAQVFEFLQKVFSALSGKLDNSESNSRPQRKTRK